MNTTPKNTYLETPDAAQALACIDCALELVESAMHRADDEDAWKTADTLAHAMMGLRNAHSDLCRVNPHAKTRLLEARHRQRDIDQQRAARTPIDNMGVPNDRRGENGS